MTKPPLVLHHAACRDGFAAAVVAKMAHPDAELMPVYYGTEPPAPEVTKGRTVFVLDFSYPRNAMKALILGSRECVVLDHHKTARAELEGILEELQQIDQRQPGDVVRFNMEKSGAGLAYEYFFPDTMPGLCPECAGDLHGYDKHDPGCPSRAPWWVRYVEDRDLWRHALPNSHEVNAFLGSIPFELDAWKSLSFMKLEDAIAAGAFIQQKVRAYVAAVSENVILVDAFGFHSIPCVNVPQTDISEVLDGLLKTFGSRIAVGWWQRKDGRFQYSLRTRAGDVDVSEIAKAHGGGGHRQAAGFERAEPMAFHLASAMPWTVPAPA